MLDINILRNNPEKVKTALLNRQMNPNLVDDFLNLDGKWRELTNLIDDNRAELNKASKSRNVEQGKKIKEKIKGLESEIKKITENRKNLLYVFPNIPEQDAPIGKDESGNKVIRAWGEKSAEPKEDYLTFSERLDLIDIKRAAKVAGARFSYLKNQVALIEFALINFAFEILVKEGFTPILPPVMIKPEFLKKTGYLSKEDDDEKYYISKDDLYLVGTSEQTVVPMHSDETLAEKDLPKRYVAFSTCFRRESGSYGKDTRGILRVHQFDKVEMVSFVNPEDSAREFQFILSIQEKLMKKLKLPYRVVDVCTGDMGPAASKQIDIETWMPSEKKYRETHSCSNTTDFQSRGLNIKYQAKGERKYLHILNGTVFSGRPIIAILENFQTKKGTVKIPSALIKYLPFKEIK